MTIPISELLFHVEEEAIFKRKIYAGDNTRGVVHLNPEDPPRVERPMHVEFVETQNPPVGRWGSFEYGMPSQVRPRHMTTGPSPIILVLFYSAAQI
ncbi:hypothetical protein TNCV_3938901 [Trichonephila clavipes]|nr:hypothetical protein TNCV_3938901 [Trichonephila clavipes]